MLGRRLLALLLVLAAIAVPAGVLRAACAGNSCDRTTARARVPFCPLPAELKAELAAGFREGRSPDVMAVTQTDRLWGGTGDTSAPPWPSVAGTAADTNVPIAFFGTGIRRGAVVPDGTGLEAVAPTLSEVLGFRRPHPDVRAGTPVPGVANGERPRLVLEVAWKGVGSHELRNDPGSWPWFRTMMKRGTGTLAGDTGSLPIDPPAVLTTIGTGGMPSQHGITGTLVRNDHGDVVRAWGPGSPFSVIAALPDDLDQAMDQRSAIGLVATDEADRGIVGGNWYVGHDRDQVVIATGDAAVKAARRLLASRFGRDDVSDVLAVVLNGTVRSMDRRTRELVGAAERASGGSVVVAVTGTGYGAGAEPHATNRGRIRVSDIVARVDDEVPGDPNLVSGVVPGGLFLDQQMLAQEGVSGEAAVRALLSIRGTDGSPVFEDAFQGFAVSFARYC